MSWVSFKSLPSTNEALLVGPKDLRRQVERGPTQQAGFGQGGSIHRLRRILVVRSDGSRGGHLTGPSLRWRRVMRRLSYHLFLKVAATGRVSENIGCLVSSVQADRRTPGDMFSEGGTEHLMAGKTSDPRTRPFGNSGCMRTRPGKSEIEYWRSL